MDMQGTIVSLMIWPWNKDASVPPAEVVARSDVTPPHAVPHMPNELPGDVEILSAVAATLPDAFLVLDAAGTVILANGHACDALDTNPVGQHISATIRAPAILDAISQVISSGEAVSADYERRVPIERRFEAFIAPIRPHAIGVKPAGMPSILILLRDLTDQQQLERMRADFVANASHELRTPLSSLVGFIETLQGAARDDNAARERFLGMMQQQAERMRRLINDLLSLSRIEMNVHLKPDDIVDLSRVARHVVEILSEMAQSNDVHIELALDEQLTVRGDWDELVQVVHNLVENAIKYAGSGKRIEIEGSAQPGGNGASQAHVVLAIRDFGPGIESEHLPRLTERFYRVNVQQSRMRGGTGLGLAIVKHILNRHRGRLTIASEHGHGSTFAIRLPAHVDDLAEFEKNI